MPRARVRMSPRASPARVSAARETRAARARGARMDSAMARAARAIAARRAIVSFVWSSRVQYTIKYTHVYIALCESPSRAGPGGNDARAKRRSRDRASRLPRDRDREASRASSTRRFVPARRDVDASALARGRREDARANAR